MRFSSEDAFAMAVSGICQPEWGYGATLHGWQQSLDPRFDHCVRCNEVRGHVDEPVLNDLTFPGVKRRRKDQA